MFTEVFGGIECLRKNHKVQLLRVFNDTPGLYGEPVGERVMGVTDGKEALFTTNHVWEIKKTKEAPRIPNSVR